MVPALYENGFIQNAESAAGIGYRTQCRDRNGLYVGDERLVAAQNPGPFPIFQSPSDIDGRNFPDHDSTQRYTAAGL